MARHKTSAAHVDSRAGPRPARDAGRGELRYGDRLVKHYRQPADNQILILDAFDAEDWPARIDNPLLAADGIDSKQRLHDTIKALNRHQKFRALRFRGDGTGQGVVWEPYQPRGKQSA